MDGIITRIAKKKMAEARNGRIQLPPIQKIAIGDGGISDEGNLFIPNEDAAGLNNEILRRDYDTAVQLSETSFRYRIDLKDSELKGKSVSEIALIDSEGDILSMKTFQPKLIEEDMEVSFEIDDIF